MNTEIIKAGFDPTSPDLHLGHSVLLKRLRQKQDLGYTVCMIIGDFTAQIGDPTGRNTQRPVLGANQIEDNAKTYLDQAFMILDPQKTIVRKNSEWLKKLSAKEMLEIMSKFTVQQMTVRRDFAERLKGETPVGLHELMYPLLQGYDSVAINAALELGGEDQLFNLHAGRDMQSIFGQKPQEVETVPLLVGIDGVHKMSKSLGNHIGLLEDPNDQFGKTMRINDHTTSEWCRVLGFGFDEEMDPYTAKKTLAGDIVEWLHGKDVRADAEKYWSTRFAKRDIQTDQKFILKPGSTLVDVLVESGMCPSKTVARQKIREGAVRVDNEKIDDLHMEIMDGMVVAVGRRVARKMIQQRGVKP